MVLSMLEGTMSRGMIYLLYHSDNYRSCFLHLCHLCAPIYLYPSCRAQGLGNSRKRIILFSSLRCHFFHTIILRHYLISFIHYCFIVHLFICITYIIWIQHTPDNGHQLIMKCCQINRASNMKPNSFHFRGIGC